MTRYDTRDRESEQLAAGLGWFSIGLGLAELAAPEAVARLIGVPATRDTTSTLRAFGARECGSGVAILSRPESASRVWSRVAGDIIDLATLAYAFELPRTDRRRLTMATVAVAGVTAIDALCAQRLSRPRSRRTRGTGYSVRVEKSTTINRPIEQVYEFWHDFRNFPRFMRHLESVELLADGRSRWRAKAPAGMTVQWDAEIVEDRDNELIAWRSLKGSTVENQGSVRFQRAPGARGTEVHVRLRYSPPAGAVGRGIAWLFGEEPDQQIADDIHRFKQLMETGEIPLSEGPGLWRAAQPPSNPEQIRRLAGVQR